MAEWIRFPYVLLSVLCIGSPSRPSWVFCPGSHRAENQVSARLASQLEALGDDLLPDLFRLLEKSSFWEAED